MVLLRKSEPRVDRYLIELTVTQIEQVAAFVVGQARARLTTFGRPLTDKQVDELTKAGQQYAEAALCPWIDDFREWAVPRRVAEPETLVPLVELQGRGQCPRVRGVKLAKLRPTQENVILELIAAGPDGLSLKALITRSGHTDVRGILTRLADSDPRWEEVIMIPGVAWNSCRLLHE